MPHEQEAFARQLHEWGAHVVAIRTGVKKPAHAWKRYQSETQLIGDVDALPWNRADRVGIINGPSGLRSFDFDSCPDWAPIRQLLAALGLPGDYQWVEQSGSGTGWHVWVQCTEVMPPAALTLKDTEPGVFWGAAKDDAFDHLELRWERNQTIIASSDGVSRWISGAPTHAPARVSVSAILRAFASVAVLPPQPPPPPPTSPARVVTTSPATGDGRDTLEAIRARFNLAEYAQTHFGGEVQREANGEVRILGHGGLLVEPQKNVWFRHATGEGGDCFDLIGLRIYGDAWNRNDKGMFREALNEASTMTGVPTEAIHVPRRLHAVNAPPQAHTDADTSSPTAWDAMLLRRANIWQAIEEGIPPIEVLVPPFLPAGRVTCVAGGPEQGKTWLLAYTVLSVARSGGKVLVLDEEAGLRDTAARMEALDLTKDDDDRIYYFPFAVGGMTLDELASAIIEGVVREGITLIVVDSWSKLFAAAGLDENSNSDATRLGRAWITPAAHEYGCAVLLLDHLAKVEDEDSRYGRGAGSKLADVDIQWHMRAVVAPTRESMGRFLLTRKKDRTATVPVSVKFLAGGDGTGRFIMRVEESSFKEQPRLNARSADAARALIGAMSMTYARWKNATEMAETTFRRARKELLEAGVVSQEQDNYWLSELGKSMFDNEGNVLPPLQPLYRHDEGGGTTTTTAKKPPYVVGEVFGGGSGGGEYPGESGGNSGGNTLPADEKGDDDDLNF